MKLKDYKTKDLIKELNRRATTTNDPDLICMKIFDNNDIKFFLDQYGYAQTVKNINIVRDHLNKEDLAQVTVGEEKKFVKAMNGLELEKISE